MPEITNHGKLFFDKNGWALEAYQNPFSAICGNNTRYRVQSPG
jgi:hypothetical protein